MMVNACSKAVAQHHNGHIVFYKSVKRCIVAMPPAIMVNHFVAIRIAQHAPPKSVVLHASLFKRTGQVSQFNSFVGQQFILIKRLIPPIHIFGRAVYAFIACYAVGKHIWFAYPVAFVAYRSLCRQPLCRVVHKSMLHAER